MLSTSLSVVLSNWVAVLALINVVCLCVSDSCCREFVPTWSIFHTQSCFPYLKQLSMPEAAIHTWCSYPCLMQLSMPDAAIHAWSSYPCLMQLSMLEAVLFQTYESMFWSVSPPWNDTAYALVSVSWILWDCGSVGLLNPTKSIIIPVFNSSFSFWINSLNCYVYWILLCKFDEMSFQNK